MKKIISCMLLLLLCTGAFAQLRSSRARIRTYKPATRTLEMVRKANQRRAYTPRVVVLRLPFSQQAQNHYQFNKRPLGLLVRRIIASAWKKHYPVEFNNVNDFGRVLGREYHHNMGPRVQAADGSIQRAFELPFKGLVINGQAADPASDVLLYNEEENAARLVKRSALEDPAQFTFIE